MIGEKLLGRYRLERRLGAGNQGEVYLAYDEHIRRSVAIKILKNAAANQTDTVVQEAIATARFEHPNVVRIHDLNSAEVPFLVMEYLNGDTADQLPRPLDPKLLRLLVSQICGALQNAHDQGLVHRDLKPGNLILVDQDKPAPRFVILDLGLAKLTDQVKLRTDITYTGAGTPLYMSPEQINAEPVDFRSDIYSFGTMLFELLTGVGPFVSHGSSLGSLLKAVCDEPAPKLSEVFPQGAFHPALEDLVRDCLKKNPADRPKSMNEINERFQAALLDQTEGDRRSPVNGRSEARLTKSSHSGWIAAAAVLVLLAGIGLNWKFVVTKLETLGRVKTAGDTDSAELVADKTDAVSGGQAKSSSTLSTGTTVGATPSDSTGSGPALSNQGPSSPKLTDSEGSSRSTTKDPDPRPQMMLKAVQIADQEIDEEQPFSVDAGLKEVGTAGTSLRYSVVTVPPSTAQIDQHGQFEWTPSEQEGPGIYHVTVVVQEHGGQKQRVESKFDLNVREVNQPPVLEMIPQQKVAGGEQLKLVVKAADPDLPENRLKYQLGPNAPQGAKLDPQSGQFDWTPTAEQSGNKYAIPIEVADDAPEPLVATGMINVIVPQIESNPKEFTNSIGMKFVMIEPGKFLMGASAADENLNVSTAAEPIDQQKYFKRERPTHPVTFTKPLYFGVYEVTQGEYQRVMLDNPSYFSEKLVGKPVPDHPVEQVTWSEANEFCRKLSELADEKAKVRRYRLPTEAEWEYACRAGTATPFHCAADQLTDFADFNFGRRTADPRPVPVGGPRKPNAWGLYDMHGNVFEWCADYFDAGYYATLPENVVAPKGPEEGNEMVFRGGSYRVDEPFYLRSAFRGKSKDVRSADVGFRVVCDP